MSDDVNPDFDKATGNSYIEAFRQADEFLTRNAARIPDALHAAGVREVLAHFAAKKADGRVVMFALDDEAVPRPRFEFELICALLAELPPTEFPGADEESIKRHLAAEKVIAEEEAKGNVIDYVEGLRRLEREKRT